MLSFPTNRRTGIMIAKSIMSIGFTLLALTPLSSTFVIEATTSSSAGPQQRVCTSLRSAKGSSTDLITQQPQQKSLDQDKVKQIKQSLMELSQRTDRGFKASVEENVKARNLIFQLAKYNPTAQPASCYYDTPLDYNDSSTIENTPSIKGKWTLIYTDAPDITSLQRGGSLFAELGRIGQECDNDNYISNIIEWKAPSWTKQLPTNIIGTNGANQRILQRVKTKASASPNRPTIVNLKVAGLEVQVPPGQTDTSSDNSSKNTDFIQRIQERGWVAGVLEQNPIKLQGPLQNVPFGQFEILYLDQEMRAIKTGQNFVAVNLRITQKENEWF